MGDVQRERDHELLEQLKGPVVHETPTNPGIVVNNTSAWGANVPRENDRSRVLSS